MITFFKEKVFCFQRSASWLNTKQASGTDPAAEQLSLPVAGSCLPLLGCQG